MINAARLARTALLAVLVLLVVLVAPAGSAHADDGVPYVDPAASGLLGLCDRQGHVLTGGSIHDKPFVWKAVTSVPAPPPYDAEGSTATLFGYQPRKGVSPGMWSGMLLTASSRFDDPAYPTAQATKRDFTLADFLGTFPAEWSGYVQLRVYLGGPGVTPRTTAYATTDIRVTGSTWHVVRGAEVSCDKGTAVSLEAVLSADNSAGLEPQTSTTPEPSVSASAAAAPAAGTGTSPRANAVAGSPVAQDQVLGAAQGMSAVRSLALLAGGVVVGLAIALGVRRRRPSTTHELDTVPAPPDGGPGRYPSTDFEEHVR